MGELGRATENYCQSLILAREFNDKRGELATIGNLGLIYQKKEDLEKALEYHKEALRLARIQDRKERYFHIFVYLCFIVIFLFMFFIFSNQLRLGAKMEQNTLAKTYPDEKPTLDTLTNRLLNK
jgi:tetratricopeptide (TPR) repeat protein